MLHDHEADQHDDEHETAEQRGPMMSLVTSRRRSVGGDGPDYQQKPVGMSRTARSKP
jgi:hypothetical protein